MGSSPFGEQHEWAMGELCEMITKKGDRIGSRPIKLITPRGADKIYDRLMLGPKGRRLRTDEKIVLLCRKAWRVVHRLYPEQFEQGHSESLARRHDENQGKARQTHGKERTGLCIRARLY